MIEKILSRIAYWIHVCEIEVNKAFADLDEDEFEYYKGQLMAYEHTKAIVQEVANDGGWIPVESGQLPKSLENVWVTVKTENDYCYVTESFYDVNFRKWRVGKLCEVIAWQPKQIPPAPYQKGE